MKQLSIVSLIISVLPISGSSQQIVLPLAEIVPKSDTILIGVVVQWRLRVLRSEDARPAAKRVPNSNKIVVPLPRLENTLGCLYRVSIEEVLKKSKQSEGKQVQLGEVVNVFVPGGCSDLDATSLPANQTVMLILSQSKLKPEEYVDAVFYDQQLPERYARFDVKDSLLPTGGIASVIDVEKQPDRVKEVKRLLGLQ
jgi:hypothetical protein